MAMPSWQLTSLSAPGGAWPSASHFCRYRLDHSTCQTGSSGFVKPARVPLELEDMSASLMIHAFGSDFAVKPLILIHFQEVAVLAALSTSILPPSMAVL